MNKQYFMVCLNEDLTWRAYRDIYTVILMHPANFIGINLVVLGGFCNLFSYLSSQDHQTAFESPNDMLNWYHKERPNLLARFGARPDIPTMIISIDFDNGSEPSYSIIVDDTDG